MSHPPCTILPEATPKPLVEIAEKMPTTPLTAVMYFAAFLALTGFAAGILFVLEQRYAPSDTQPWYTKYPNRSTKPWFLR